MANAMFHWADYLVFTISLLISCAVGVFFGCRGKKQTTTEEFLMAGRNMAVLPVSFSLFVSWLSGISFLGDPVEAYSYGSVYWIIGFGYAVALVVIAHIFVPVYHKMKLTSSFEYLGNRFTYKVRILGAIIDTLATVGWLAIALYAPALALSQASGMPIWVSILVVSIVCMFYTTLGGMKAVLWADSLQLFIMVSGMLAACIQGVITVGGAAEVWTRAQQGGRLNMFTSFDPNPFLRASFWIYLIGGYFRIQNTYISQQIYIQRYGTVSTSRRAQLAVYINIPLYLALVFIFGALGLVMFAYYHDCDPLLNGRIQNRDQMLPLLVLELLGFLPGVPGLFLACILAAALSSLSSGLNSLSTVALRDFLMPIYKYRVGKDMSDSLATKSSKFLGLVYGVLVTIMAFVIMQGGGGIFALTNLITGAFQLAAIFIIGVVFPNVKTKSVLVGFVVATAWTMWWLIGSSMYPPKPYMLPLRTDGCPALNATYNNVTDGLYASNGADAINYDVTNSGSSSWNATVITATPQKSFQTTDLYSWNNLYFMPLGTLVAVVIALLFHLINSIFERRKSDTSKEDISMSNDKKDSCHPGDLETQEALLSKAPPL